MSRCWIEIDADALVYNARLLRHRLPVGTALMAVVKADGYGHGAGTIVGLLREEVEWFGVASLGEAEALGGGIAPDRIFLLSAPLPEERDAIVARGYRTWIGSSEEAKAFARIAGQRNRRMPVHIKIDTGMGRLGVLPDRATGLIALCQTLPELVVEGVATHLPVADENPVATEEQIARFATLIERLRAAGFQGRWIHACNSAGSLQVPFGNLCRIGLALYGVNPGVGQLDLRPVLTWKTRVAALRQIPVGHPVSYGSTWHAERPTTLAVLAVGYADGYPRAVSGRGARVLVRGMACPLLGRVTMDQIMVDVTDLPGVEAGEEAVLLGRDGGAVLSAEELAACAGTIPWEIFTNLSRPRVDRLLRNAEGSDASL